MPNKNRKYINNPVRINTYNKFLSTLDNTIPINITHDFNKPPENTTTITNNSDNNEYETKKVIDDFIEKLNKMFNDALLTSNNFTGQTYNDNITAKLEVNDQNMYEDDFVLKPLPRNRKNKQPEIKEPEPIIVNIEAEINNISDILALVEKYKIEPGVKYNINMKILHDIKEPLDDLNNMIGMKQLKNNIVDQILYFAQELHKNKNKSGDFMHTVIYGPPGTGKTEIAKIMGKIYSKLGVLSKGTFKKVTRSDLIAGYLGQTALKTQDVIKEALGGVLFIDEAYALGNSGKSDSFSKECIDTLCEALSDNKENLMVIVAGYETELKNCFFNYNQGLDSRFTWRFKTDEYEGEDLYNIFMKKIKDIGWECDTNEKSKITIDWFKKNKDYFKFFGRDIETLIAKTKIAHSRRVFCMSESEKKKISNKDLEKGFEIYLKNEDVKNRKDEEYLKRQIYSSLYC